MTQIQTHGNTQVGFAMAQTYGNTTQAGTWVAVLRQESRWISRIMYLCRPCLRCQWAVARYVMVVLFVSVRGGGLRLCHRAVAKFVMVVGGRLGLRLRQPGWLLALLALMACWWAPLRF